MTSDVAEQVVPVVTDQMPLACYLWFRGHDLESMSWSGNRCSWKFSPEALEDKVTFEKGMARVDPGAYYVAVREFKQQTWNNNPLRSSG
jgi:hypothetical protein